MLNIIRTNIRCDGILEVSIQSIFINSSEITIKEIKRELTIKDGKRVFDGVNIKNYKGLS
jgi:hypothetical protein